MQLILPRGLQTGLSGRAHGGSCCWPWPLALLAPRQLPAGPDPLRAWGDTGSLSCRAQLWLGWGRTAGCTFSMCRLEGAEEAACSFSLNIASSP